MDDTQNELSEVTVEVTEDTTTPETESTDQSTVFLSVENLIKSNIATLDTLQQQFREQKEMVDNVLENDQTYREHLEQAKEANKVKSTTKQQIMKRPDVIKIAEKMKDLREEMKETNATLSDLLEEYKRISGSNIFEDDNGEIREIVSTSKLIKKGSK